MLIRIPIGPLLIFEDGLNPRIGSALLARSSSISPMAFMMLAECALFLINSSTGVPSDLHEDGSENDTSAECWGESTEHVGHDI
tara:strand:- start:89 stop:340 length:252 start_codon:yes stop_codon:yes gene_type:complete